MNGGLIHNKKFNLVAFLSMGLFLLIDGYLLCFLLLCVFMFMILDMGLCI